MCNGFKVTSIISYRTRTQFRDHNLFLFRWSVESINFRYQYEIIGVDVASKDKTIVVVQFYINICYLMIPHLGRKAN